jgi:hypothetical protein
MNIRLRSKENLSDRMIILSPWASISKKAAQAQAAPGFGLDKISAGRYRCRRSAPIGFCLLEREEVCEVWRFV